MCIDLYVDKVLVYTDCVPDTPSPVPSPMPIPSVFAIPNLNYTPSTSSPSPNTTPIVNGIDNHLETPSAMPIMNTTISPSSNNASNMTEFQDSMDASSEFIDNVTIAGIVLATVMPILLLCILVYRRCRRQSRVQPVQCKKKKKSCCCKDDPTLPEKQTRSTTTGTYLNQPPLPMSLPPTPRET